MQLVTVTQDNHEVLRKIAEEVEIPVSKETQQIITDMKSLVVDELKNPVGLAAPQVGISLRIMLIEIPEEAAAYKQDANALPLTVFINPSYTPIPEKGMEKDWEGCFSVPDMMGEVYRYKAIHFEAFTEDGEKIRQEIQGYFARVFQHETDHLNGKLYIDLIKDDCRYGHVDEMIQLRRRELVEYLG